MEPIRDAGPAIARALRSGSALKATLVVVLLLATLGAAAFALTLRLTRIDDADLGRAAPPPPHAAAATPSAPAPADLAAAALDGVVTVEVAAGDSSVALGTGWLLDSQGDVVTNQHVIAEQRNLRIVDRAGAAHAGTVLGVDTGQDIAVVRAPDLAGRMPLTVDPSSEPPLPEPAVVLASARATGHGDRTQEQLVRLHQTVPLAAAGSSERPVPGQPSVYTDMMVLTGATIYRGNSGGPVLDGHGDVIGIVTLAAETTPQAFAIPLARVLDELHRLAARPTTSP